jgi:uncharacterized protein YutE (UPF0331/DUF86 family)
LEKEIQFRLIKHLGFLKNELEDYPIFQTLTWKEYNLDRGKRRNIERWIENIVNSSVDLAKIILTLENIPIPDTYGETVRSLSLLPYFDKEATEKMAQWVRLRNIISHEYLDIRWASIERFTSQSAAVYFDFADKMDAYLQDKII